MTRNDLKRFATVCLTVSALELGSGALAIRRALANPPAQSSAAHIVERALQAAEAIPDPEERARTLLSIGWAQIRQGDKAGARATLTRARQAAEAIRADGVGVIIPHPIIMIAVAQAEAGDREAAHQTFLKAVKVVEAQSDEGQSAEWINFLPKQIEVEGRAAAKETIAAYRRHLERELRRQSWFPFVKLLGLQAQAGDFAGALRTVRESPEFQGPERADHRRQAMVAIVGGLRAGDQQIAGPILKEARKAIEDNDKVWFRAQDLAAVALAQARMRQFKAALATVQEIDIEPRLAKNPDINPAEAIDKAKFRKALTLIEIAKEQLKAGDDAGARASALMVLGVVSTIKEDARKPAPLNDAAEILAEAGDFEGAVRAARSVIPEWRLNLMRTIAWEQREHGDGAGARETLQQALRLAEELGKTDQIATLQARMGDLQAALRTIDRIKNDEAREQALAEVAAGRAWAGDAARALELVETIRSPDVRERAWIGLATILPGRKLAKKPTRGP